MALHEQSVGKSNEWYTPRRVFDALGCTFDMDVAAPFDRQHVCVPTNRWIFQESLRLPWSGFVWMNPPFGGRNGLSPWLHKFFEHGDGIALVPDRTSAPWWGDYVPKADSVLFVRHKLRFVRPDGSEGGSPAQGTCLLALGKRAVDALNTAQSRGLGFVFVPGAAV